MQANRVMMLFCSKRQMMGGLPPVYYMSKKTNTAEEKYSSYELEVLAIVAALKKLRVYLLGQKVKIVTNCSAFQKTMGKKDLVTRIARWVMLLEEFDYEIIHRPV
ncbi:transposon Tf2-6 polyprotein [Trichonephila clavipes]|nr:transposon Tf2-6 polyprotein [Trichonephila clavipes]